MRSTAKIIARIIPEYSGNIERLLEESAEFIEGVGEGKHYIFRDGSRFLFNAEPTDGNSNPMVNVSIDTLVLLQQKAKERDLLLEFWRGYGPCPEHWAKLAQILAE